MNIYFSGINGTGIGPLAEFVNDLGYGVFGSDQNEGLLKNELEKKGISYLVGEQDGTYLKKIVDQHGIDWFVYSSAISDDHPELVLAKELGIKTSKRDDLINHLLSETGLKLIAVAGTHGKTTSSAMLVWTLLKLGVPVSYMIGTTIDFGPSGHYDRNSEYLVYECDEYDRNFLKFHPDLSLVTTISHDHVDIYPTEDDYINAFRQFAQQSKSVIAWGNGADDYFEGMQNIDNILSVNSSIDLPGKHNRQNATLVLKAIQKTWNEIDEDKIVSSLNSYPGAKRRFEKLIDGLYSDYAHHPDEISATIDLAKELSQKIAVIYEPHQNTRQHQVCHLYGKSFTDADKVIWLPTYLTRENQSLDTLSPEHLTKDIPDSTEVVFSRMDEQLINDIKELLSQGFLVIAMSAGPLDSFLRQNLSTIKSA